MRVSWAPLARMHHRMSGLLVLLIALGVFVHHGLAGATAASADMAQHSMTAQVQVQSSPHHSTAPACDMSVTQLCTAASVDSVTIVPPAASAIDWLFAPTALLAVPVVGGLVARGPPARNLISVLRI
ncbi:MAG: hypothetical protein HOV83_33260 [Catenulispora sp.]|nr:hypothetical protein [Catenulispora sp.]